MKGPLEDPCVAHYISRYVCRPFNVLYFPSLRVDSYLLSLLPLLLLFLFLLLLFRCRGFIYFFLSLYFF